MPKTMRTVWLVLAVFWVLLLGWLLLDWLLGGERPRATEVLMVGCGLASAVCGLLLSHRPGPGFRGRLDCVTL